MLSTFSVRNFKSFNDWFTFDLSDVKSYEFNANGIRDSVVNKALIYGHNGVGKSNLGLAIFDIILHTTDKNRDASNYANYLNAESESEVAEFRYTFKFGEDSLQYDYGKRSHSDIVYERLSVNGERVVEYDREHDSVAKIDIPGTETLNRDLSRIKISVVKYIRSNSVFTESRASSVLMTFFSFVDRMLLFWSLDTRGYQGYEIGTRSIFTDIIDRGHFDHFKKFLASAGVDSNLKIMEINGEKKVVFDFGGNQSIDFWSACSTGMRSLTLFYYWLQRVRFESDPPSLLFIDEFDAFYHLSIAEQVIRELIDTKGQVILTTHNTSLMSNDLLRPDCFFLMYKQRIDPLHKLTDKELRQAHNIEKMYRAGAFGA